MWPNEAIRRALAALKQAAANPAGAGPAAVMEFRGHVVTIVSATRDPVVRAIGDELIGCAEELFNGPRGHPESYYRERLFNGQQQLSRVLKTLGLVD